MESSINKKFVDMSKELYLKMFQKKCIIKISTQLPILKLQVIKI